MNTKKSGFLLINKPENITSHDVVNQLRRVTKIKKIGHAGTLDPFATGLLIVAIGREATKKIDTFVKLDKVYTTKIKLGEVSNTFDKKGKITFFSDIKPTLDEVTKTLKKFEGEQKQIPPMFSAKKIKGKKLYELARKGIEVKRQPNDINIYYIKLLEYEYPYLSFETKVSSGTYIRALGNDIGISLKTGAYLEELERTKIGVKELKKAQQLVDINSQYWSDFLFNE